MSLEDRRHAGITPKMLKGEVFSRMEDFGRKYDSYVGLHELLPFDWTLVSSDTPEFSLVHHYLYRPDVTYSFQFDHNLGITHLHRMEFISTEPNKNKTSRVLRLDSRPSEADIEYIYQPDWLDKYTINWSIFRPGDDHTYHYSNAEVLKVFDYLIDAAVANAGQHLQQKLLSASIHYAQ